MPRVLYISYDGALDPLGSSQIVPYLERLAECGYEMTFLTFEKPERWADSSRRSAMAARLALAGISWIALPYRKWPPVIGSFVDLFQGELELRRRFPPGHFDLIHVRTYPPALIASRLKRRFGAGFLFDIRGFYTEERTEGGLWRPGGVLFRLLKRLERRFFGAADAVVTLTEASVPVLTDRLSAIGSQAPIHVIPTCVDLERFRAGRSPGAPDGGEGTDEGTGPRFVYFGSIGTWYMLDEMVEFAEVVLDRVEGSEVHFYVNTEVERVRGATAHLDSDRVRVASLGPDQLAAALGEADVAFHFIRPTFSKKASSATKVGEALACGLPILTNPGIGDVEAQLAGDGEGRIGVLVGDLSRGGYARAVDEVMELLADPGTPARCRSFAEQNLSLELAVGRYDSAYRSLLKHGPPPKGPSEPTTGGVLLSDVCGTLFHENTTFGFLRYVSGERGSAHRLAHGVLLGRASPVLIVLRLVHRLLGADLARPLGIRLLRGLSRERLEALAEEYVSRLMEEDRVEAVWSVIDRRRAQGRELVLVSASIDPVVSALADRLGVEWHSSHLEYRDGHATGRLTRSLSGRKHEVVAVDELVGPVTAVTDDVSDTALLRESDEAFIVVTAGNRLRWAGDLRAVAIEPGPAR